jgi:hypothetical protein
MLTRRQIKNLPTDEVRLLHSYTASELRLRSTANGIVAQLASMAEGEVRYIETTIHALGTLKRHARIRLANASAQWSGRTTNKGLKVTRTS